VTTYRKVLSVLEDGRWHTLHELRSVSHFPAEWVRELKLSGHLVDERPSDKGERSVRLVATAQR
jgi:hypothetical protein